MAMEPILIMGIRLLVILCLSQNSLYAQDENLESGDIGTDAFNSAALVSTYWVASGRSENEAKQNLITNADGEIERLYDWLSTGPTYSADVPLGIQNAARNSQGTRFPYVYVVPKEYDPAKAYPVEFFLHGGISRAEWNSRGKWWLEGSQYEKYQELNQISVFPAAWNEQPWWREEQAENLREILVSLKKLYNIDDNRVFLSGVSDGGTGAFYTAFTQPSEWAAFLPYISHPQVLVTEGAIRGDNYDFENLKNSSFYIVNGTDDHLYPADAVQTYIDVLEVAEVDHQFVVIEGGKHNLNWLSAEQANIDHYKNQREREPHPRTLRWSADNPEANGRIHWLRIDELESRRTPGWISAAKDGNTFYIYTLGVEQFSLLLHPEEVDFSQPIRVLANDEVVHESILTQDAEVLFNWAGNRDRTQLYTAELSIELSF